MSIRKNTQKEALAFEKALAKELQRAHGFHENGALNIAGRAVDEAYKVIKANIGPNPKSG